MSLHLLLIGGTVFLGRHIVDTALAAGHSVTLFNRGRSAPSLFRQVEGLHGDRDTAEGLAALHGRRFDAVIDTCGYRPGQVRSMAAALHAAHADAPPPYLFVSSISAYLSFPPHAPYDEDAALAEGDEGYGPLKARSEEALTAAWAGPVCIVRPGLIVGPHDPTGRFTYWPQRVARGGEVLAPGRPERPVQWIDVRDLAAWCVRLVEVGGEGVFNAVGPTHTMAALLNACHEVSCSDARFTWVPDAELQAAGINPWTELPLWLPEDDPTHGGMLLGDAGRAVEAGLRCRPIEDSVRSALAWAQRLEAPPATAVATLLPEKEAAWLAARPSSA